MLRTLAGFKPYEIWGFEMVFKMKVEDVFRIGKKTVFTGALETQEKTISDILCTMQIDGAAVGHLRICGEVSTGKAHRDLWTLSPVHLSREAISKHEVWLVSA